MRCEVIDFARALQGNPLHNIELLNGDSLVIQFDPQTVLVTGAVSRSALVRFVPGRSMRDYIELAGGPTEKGDLGKAVVDYPSGVSKRVHRVAFLFRTSPEIVSGSTIIVPQKPVPTDNVGDLLTRALSYTTALASILVAYAAVKR